MFVCVAVADAVVIAVAVFANKAKVDAEHARALVTLPVTGARGAFALCVLALLLASAAYEQRLQINLALECAMPVLLSKCEQHQQQQQQPQQRQQQQQSRPVTVASSSTHFYRVGKRGVCVGVASASAKATVSPWSRLRLRLFKHCACLFVFLLFYFCCFVRSYSFVFVVHERFSACQIKICQNAAIVAARLTVSMRQ